MSFTSQGQLAQKGEFRLKVKIALIAVAQAVVQETEPIPNTRAYVYRHNYAVQILNDPDSKLSAFAFGLVTLLPSADDNTPDTTIQSNINAMFNYYVGIKNSDNTTNFP